MRKILALKERRFTKHDSQFKRKRSDGMVRGGTVRLPRNDMEGREAGRQTDSEVPISRLM